MKNLAKGVLVVIVTILLLAVMLPKARAGTADEFLKILSDKRIVYQGVCWFDKSRMLTFKKEEMKTIVPCVVGFELGVTTKHYVVICNDEYIAQEVVLYDDTDKSQKTLWRRGMEV